MEITLKVCKCIWWNKFIFKEKTYSVQNFWNDPRTLCITLVSNFGNKSRSGGLSPPDRNTRLSQTLDHCDKAQWRLHWRSVNVFCEINSFLKRNIQCAELLKWPTYVGCSEITISIVVCNMESRKIFSLLACRVIRWVCGTRLYGTWFNFLLLFTT
jgi:hypothetical protein